MAQLLLKLVCILAAGRGRGKEGVEGVAGCGVASAGAPSSKRPIAASFAQQLAAQASPEDIDELGANGFPLGLRVCQALEPVQHALCRPGSKGGCPVGPSGRARAPQAQRGRTLSTEMQIKAGSRGAQAGAARGHEGQHRAAQHGAACVPRGAAHAAGHSVRRRAPPRPPPASSTLVTGRCRCSLKVSITRSPSLYRSRPLSTNTQCRRSPSTCGQRQAAAVSVGPAVLRPTGGACVQTTRAARARTQHACCLTPAGPTGQPPGNM